jgi:hypothetical protein
MIYAWKWLFTLVAQGETVEEFHYWRMMLNDFLDYFDVAPELWFALSEPGCHRTRKEAQGTVVYPGSIRTMTCKWIYIPKEEKPHG